MIVLSQQHILGLIMTFGMMGGGGGGTTKDVGIEGKRALCFNQGSICFNLKEAENNTVHCWRGRELYFL
jgi:hypothetical protein